MKAFAVVAVAAVLVQVTIPTTTTHSPTPGTAPESSLTLQTIDTDLVALLLPLSWLLPLPTARADATAMSWTRTVWTMTTTC